MRESTQVLIRPVISEKTYGLMDRNTYVFVVDPRATKIDIRRAVEDAFEVRVDKVNTLNRKGKARRNRRTDTWGRQASTKRAYVTLHGGDTHRPLRELIRSSEMALRITQAHQPRPAVPVGLGLLRDHPEPSRALARLAPAQLRRPQQLRPQDGPPPRRRAQAPVPPWSISGVTRTACPPRWRPSSTTPTATPASPCCTTWTARSATSWPPPRCGSATGCRAVRARRSVPGTRSPMRYIPVGSVIHNVELRPGGGGKLARGAGMSVQLVAKEGLFATLRLPSTEMRRVSDRLPGHPRRGGEPRGRADQARQGGSQPLEGRAAADPWRRHEPGGPSARGRRGQVLGWATPGVAVGQARGSHPGPPQGVGQDDRPPPPHPRRPAVVEDV